MSNSVDSSTTFKNISIFLLGLIVGYMIKGSDFSMFLPKWNGPEKLLGNPNAPITMIEFTDFECPLCQKFFQESYPVIKEKYIQTGQVKYLVRHFPLNIHPEAEAAALASECALDQGKFPEMHDALFDTQESWAGNPQHLAHFKKLAGDLHLNQSQFDQCLDNQTHLEKIRQEAKQGGELNIEGTPTFFINNEKIVGAQDTSIFENTIEKYLSQP